MAREDYVKQGDSEFCAQLVHVNVTIPQFLATLTITAADPHIVALAADAACFEYLCARQSALKGASAGATAERNRARYGDKDSPNTAVTLAYPSGPGIPSPILPGVEERFRKLVEFLRTRPGWTDDIAQTLDVLGAEQTPADSAALKPVIPLSITGGHVYIAWKWQSARGLAKALRIEVNRGNGWEFLTIDTQPGYTDKTPWPANPAKWLYRAIFVRDEENIGQWSDVAEITVGA